MAVAVDMELARSYQQALRDMSESLGVKNDITAGLLARFPDVLVARQPRWTRNSCGAMYRMWRPVPCSALWRCGEWRAPRCWPTSPPVWIRWRPVWTVWRA